MGANHRDLSAAALPLHPLLDAAWQRSFTGISHSLALHSLVLVLAVVPLLSWFTTPQPPGIPLISNPLWAPEDLRAAAEPSKGGGNGGRHEPDPPTRGSLPRPHPWQFTPPIVRIVKPDPVLPIEPTIAGVPDLRLAPPELTQGSPFMQFDTSSAGPSGPAGIGDGPGTTVGPGGKGPGAGPGNNGEGVYRPGTRGIGLPECVYCPLPVYSAEAVKAKYQGPVMLRVVVSADGRVSDCSVVQSPGLGLDEKAIEAVRKWTFRPSRGPGGKLVEVAVFIEVTFRLL